MHNLQLLDCWHEDKQSNRKTRKVLVCIPLFFKTSLDIQNHIYKCRVSQIFESEGPGPYLLGVRQQNLYKILLSKVEVVYSSANM